MGVNPRKYMQMTDQQAQRVMRKIIAAEQRLLMVHAIGMSVVLAVAAILLIVAVSRACAFGA